MHKIQQSVETLHTTTTTTTTFIMWPVWRIVAAVVFVVALLVFVLWRTGLGPFYAIRPVTDAATDKRILDAIARDRGLPQGVPKMCNDPNGFAGLFREVTVETLPHLPPTVAAAVVKGKVCLPCWSPASKRFSPAGPSTLPQALFEDADIQQACSGKSSAQCWKWLCGVEGSSTKCTDNYFVDPSSSSSASTASTPTCTAADGHEVVPVGWCSPGPSGDQTNVCGCVQAATEQVCNQTTGASAVSATPNTASPDGPPTITAASHYMNTQFSTCWADARKAGVQDPTAVCSDVVLRVGQRGHVGGLSYQEYVAMMKSNSASPSSSAPCEIPTPPHCDARPGWCVRTCGTQYGAS